MEIYNKEQIKNFKMDIINNYHAKEISEKLLCSMQDKIIEYMLNNKQEIRFDFSSYNDLVKEKICIALKELGYYFIFDSNEIIINVNHTNSLVKTSEDIVSEEADRIYFKYPLMPAYSALAILELSNTQDHNLITEINEIVDKLVELINENIKEELKDIKNSNSNKQVVLITYDHSLHMGIEDIILSNIYEIGTTPFEKFFEALGFNINSDNNLIGYTGSKCETVKFRILRAPILVKLIEKLKQSSLDFKGTNWNDDIIIINL